MTTPLDPQVAERLAYIRFLHREGIAQAQRNAPYSLVAILTLHDAVELFYGLIADKFCPTLNPRTAFDDYAKAINAYPRSATAGLPQGVSISSGRGIRRLNDVRVQMKHYGSLPSQHQVDQGVLDVASFLTVNTLAIFDADYDSLTMVDVVPQQHARNKLQAARTAWDSDPPEAMALLVEAFQDLFEHPRLVGNEPNPAFEFGGRIQRLGEDRLTDAVFSLQPKPGRDKGWGYKDLARQIDQTTGVAILLQEAMRVMSTGMDYIAYHKFKKLTPGVYGTMDGKRHRSFPKNYAPTAEDFAFCEDFTVKLAIRLSAIDAELA